MLEIHGKPVYWKPRQNIIRSYQALVDNQRPQDYTFKRSIQSRTTRIALQFFFQLSKFQIIICLSTYKGNHLRSFVTTQIKIPWIIDFGLLDHMYNAYHLFTSYSPCVGHFKVRIADRSLIRCQKIEYLNFKFYHPQICTSCSKLIL